MAWPQQLFDVYHVGTLYSSQTGQPSRLRNFPHVEGNYALHVFIPGYIFFSTCVRWTGIIFFFGIVSFPLNDTAAYR